VSQDLQTRPRESSRPDRRPTKTSTDPDNKQHRLLPGEPLGRDLLKNRFASAVMRSRWYPGVIQIPIAAVFKLVAYQLPAGPATAHENAGTALMWVLWWPALPLVYVLFGRFWCAVCPFAALSDFVQKLVGVNRPVPPFLKKYGIWIIDATFLAITWADHVFGIVGSHGVPEGAAPTRVHLGRGLRTAVPGQEVRTSPSFSSLCFSAVQILRSMRPPRGPTSGPSNRNHPFGRTCQSQPMTVSSPSAVRVSAPEVSIIELVVSEPSRCGRSNSVSSTTISMSAFPMWARNRVPSPMGAGVSSSTSVMAGLNEGSLRESATVSKTCSGGAAMRTCPVM
jgi:4Fe-4S binding domain